MNQSPHILLRSAWQTVNIGDIGHTPGALRLFQQHFPEARVTLWPILALAQGTPAIFIRQPTDTCKGQMWHDVGLPPNFLEVHEATGEVLWQRLSQIHADYPAAQSQVAAICATVEKQQAQMAVTVKRVFLTTKKAGQG